MHRNVEPLAMNFVDHKMFLVPKGHVISNDTKVSVLHLPCNMGMWNGHFAFEKVVLCSKGLLHWNESFVSTNMDRN